MPDASAAPQGPLDARGGCVQVVGPDGRGVGTSRILQRPGWCIARRQAVISRVTGSTLMFLVHEMFIGERLVDVPRGSRRRPRWHPLRGWRARSSTGPRGRRRRRDRRHREQSCVGLDQPCSERYWKCADRATGSALTRLAARTRAAPSLAVAAPLVVALTRRCREPTSGRGRASLRSMGRGIASQM